MAGRLPVKRLQLVNAVSIALKFLYSGRCLPEDIFWKMYRPLSKNYLYKVYYRIVYSIKYTIVQYYVYCIKYTNPPTIKFFIYRAIMIKFEK